MRPDQNPRLTEMGIGQATCDKCMMELYSDADDSICNNCGLNAMSKGADPKQFIKEVMDHESSFSLDELKKRHVAMNK